MQGATNFKQYVHLNQQSREMQAAKKRLLDEIDGTMNAEGKTLHCEDGTNFFVRLPPKPKKATLDIDFVVVGFTAFFAEKGIDIGANDAQEFGRTTTKQKTKNKKQNKMGFTNLYDNLEAICFQYLHRDIIVEWLNLAINNRHWNLVHDLLSCSPTTFNEFMFASICKRCDIQDLSTIHEKMKRKKLVLPHISDGLLQTIYTKSEFPTFQFLFNNFNLEWPVNWCFQSCTDNQKFNLLLLRATNTDIEHAFMFLPFSTPALPLLLRLSQLVASNFITERCGFSTPLSLLHHWVQHASSKHFTPLQFKQCGDIDHITQDVLRFLQISNLLLQNQDKAYFDVGIKRNHVTLCQFFYKDGFEADINPNTNYNCPIFVDYLLGLPLSFKLLQEMYWNLRSQCLCHLPTVLKRLLSFPNAPSQCSTLTLFEHAAAKGSIACMEILKADPRMKFDEHMSHKVLVRICSRRGFVPASSLRWVFNHDSTIRARAHVFSTIVEQSLSDVESMLLLLEDETIDKNAFICCLTETQRTILLQHLDVVTLVCRKDIQQKTLCSLLKDAFSIAGCEQKTMEVLASFITDVPHNYFNLVLVCQYGACRLLEQDQYLLKGNPDLTLIWRCYCGAKNEDIVRILWTQRPFCSTEMNSQRFWVLYQCNPTAAVFLWNKGIVPRDFIFNPPNEYMLYQPKFLRDIHHDI